jgi:succinyl-CoA synthetase beta subunit
MQLLEHDAKARLAAHGVAIPRGVLVASPTDAATAAHSIGGPVAVKAQVPIGGRGRAGAIKLVDPDRAAQAADELLGSTFRGFPVDRVLVEQAIEAVRELYLGITVDPRLRRPVLLLGAAGGIDVEEGADSIARVSFSACRSLRPAQVWLAASRVGIADRAEPLIAIALAVADVFHSERARLVEVNPLVETNDGSFVAADVRIVPASATDAGDTLDPIVRESARLGFDLLLLDEGGDVGLITTGAGASMLLVDLLRAEGLRPINFCDLRTGSLRGDPSRIDFVLSTLAASRGLHAIAVNVFAGVTDLDEFARLLLRALGRRPLGAPVVARVEGRGAQSARWNLADAGLEVAHSLEDLVARVRRRVRVERLSEAAR